jgi:Homeobox KN domain
VLILDILIRNLERIPFADVMDTRLEAGDEEFADFIDFPSSFSDNGCQPQYHFSDANFDLQHQGDLFWNVPNTIEDQSPENQFDGNQTFNNAILHSKADASHPAPSYPQKLRRQRLSKFQKSCLCSWLFVHQSYPYPSAEEVRALAAETLLTEKQVRTWFNNARSRQGPQGKPSAHKIFT